MQLDVCDVTHPRPHLRLLLAIQKNDQYASRRQVMLYALLNFFKESDYIVLSSHYCRVESYTRG